MNKDIIFYEQRLTMDFLLLCDPSVEPGGKFAEHLTSSRLLVDANSISVGSSDVSSAALQGR
ncbi:hypothetical protein INR49_003681 [Caranx melampygus]|nr:hypothetical protein INR49_003681 [Caranx melampygus]